MRPCGLRPVVRQQGHLHIRRSLRLRHRPLRNSDRGRHRMRTRRRFHPRQRRTNRDPLRSAVGRAHSLRERFDMHRCAIDRHVARPRTKRPAHLRRVERILRAVGGLIVEFRRHLHRRGTVLHRSRGIGEDQFRAALHRSCATRVFRDHYALTSPLFAVIRVLTRSVFLSRFSISTNCNADCRPARSSTLNSTLM